MKDNGRNNLDDQIHTIEVGGIAAVAPAVNINAGDVKKIASDVNGVVVKANTMQIRSDDENREAQNIFLILTDAETRLGGVFNDQIKHAHHLHKFLISMRDSIGDRIAQARAIVKGKVDAYIAEQRAAAELLRKKVEDEKKEHDKKIIAALKETGDKGAVKAYKQEVASAPAIVPTYVPPVIEGVGTRKTWTYNVKNMKKLVAAIVAGKEPSNIIKFSDEFIASVPMNFLAHVNAGTFPMSSITIHERNMNSHAAKVTNSRQVDGIEIYQKEGIKTK